VASVFELVAGKAIGYAAGSGGYVEQPTSKSTAVTINAPCGRIKTDDQTLTALSPSRRFKVNNSFMSPADCVILNHSARGAQSGYVVDANFFEEGAFHITVQNVAGGSLSQHIDINFAIIKSAIE